MDDIERQLGTKRENFPLLLTDQAHYMSFAGRTLKKYMFKIPFFDDRPAFHTYFIIGFCEDVLTLKMLMT